MPQVFITAATRRSEAVLLFSERRQGAEQSSQLAAMTEDAPAAAGKMLSTTFST